MADWKQLFTFTKQERNGIAVLAVVLVSAVIYLFLQPALFEPATVPTEIPAEYLAAKNTTPGSSNASFTSQDKEDHHPDMAKIAGQKTVYQQNELFLFNPNGLAESDWVRLGLSPAQAKSVKNFEDKGGFFRTKEDVKKLYVISAEKYKELEPYIVIPQRESFGQRNDSLRRIEKPREQMLLELNTADTAQLVKLDSIGPVLAARIVAYRSRLGGFHRKEQLREVYGLTEAKYATIQSSFRCDSTYVTKINVNTASASELKQHPYVTPSVANALVNYRKQHGNFRQLSDIMLCKVITPELYAKLVPYLSL